MKSTPLNRAPKVERVVVETRIGRIVFKHFKESDKYTVECKGKVSLRLYRMGNDSTWFVRIKDVGTVLTRKSPEKAYKKAMKLYWLQPSRAVL